MKRTAEPTVIKTVSVSLLGGFALELDGTTLTDDINRSLKLWSVLAYLILHRDRPVPQTEFIETFWPDDNSSNPVNALKTLLYRIRSMLEPLFGELQPILAQRGAYLWNPAAGCDLDTDRFEALCAQASDESLSSESRMGLYRSALSLYQGDLLRKLDHQQRKKLSVLGASCHSAAEASEAEALGCTYITAGHIFNTDCKAGVPGRGTDFLKQICSRVSIPVYAIGGIDPANAAAVREAGAAGICVMSAAMTCADPSALSAALGGSPENRYDRASGQTGENQ